MVASVLQTIPVKPHVGLQMIELWQGGSPGNLQSVSVSQKESSRQRKSLFATNDNDARRRWKGLKYQPKEQATVRRRSMVPHVRSKNSEEVVEKLSSANLSSKVVFFPLAYLGTKLCFETLH